MASSSDITAGRVLRYSLLPQILPRLVRLAGPGHLNAAVFLAAIFRTTGILSASHPFFLDASRYSFFAVLREAARNITFDWKNIDKITIFGAVLASIILFILQVILLVLALIALPAYAYDGPGLGPRTAAAFIENPNPKTDIAFRLLDLVFGIPGIFDSNNAGTTPFHTGLHALFEFYSLGMLLVATIIIIYLVTAIVLETAESGVPFGKRFNHAWAPVRVILFFGLLLPTGNGINLAQYLLLNAAKLGSNVSTNAWITFDKAAKAPYFGTPEQMVAVPNIPNLNTFATFMALAKTCAWAEGRVNGRDIRPYFVYAAGGGSDDMTGQTPAFNDMVKKAKGGTLYFRFGVKDTDKYKLELGSVFPYCGELGMPVIDQAQPGAAMIQHAYAEMIMCMWAGRAGSSVGCQQQVFDNQGRDYTSRYAVILPYNPYPDMTPYVGQSQKTSIMVTLHEDFEKSLKDAAAKQAKEGKWNVAAPTQYGWAGAGIWYNKIAEQNGALTSAVFNRPEVVLMPYVMEYVKNEKRKQNPNTPLLELYTPTLANGKMIEFFPPDNLEVSRTLNQLFKYWGSQHALAFFRDTPETHNQELTGNAIIDVMNVFMGTRGLFDMCRNTLIHPLAQLSSLGRGLVEHSIRAFAAATGIAITGGIASILNKSGVGQAILGASKFFITFAGIGLLLGFILFYVIPFLPFIYFFFAVMTWVKSIFEAMVAAPLWALAHLKIDGTGMPGEQASLGYFYMLEIFLRPIGILIGLLGSVVIFSAMVKVLNEIFYLVISNLSGHFVGESTTGCFNPPAASTTSGGAAAQSGQLTEQMFKRGVVDEFFYTVIYAIIVYMMALPCFKLVDQIPDYVTRWLGAGIQPFGSQDGDPAQGLVKNVTIGAGAVAKGLEGAGASLGLK